MPWQTIPIKTLRKNLSTFPEWSGIVSSGLEAMAIRADVSCPEDMVSAIERTVDMWGRLDILVPNAGIQFHNEDLNLHQLDEGVWNLSLIHI